MTPEEQKKYEQLIQQIMGNEWRHIQTMLLGGLADGVTEIKGYFHYPFKKIQLHIRYLNTEGEETLDPDKLLFDRRSFEAWAAEGEGAGGENIRQTIFKICWDSIHGFAQQEIVKVLDPDKSPPAEEKWNDEEERYNEGDDDVNLWDL